MTNDVFGLVILSLLGAATLSLTGIFFFRRALFRNRRLKVSLLLLVGVAISLNVYQIVANPTLPAAVASYELREPYAPTKITLANRSSDYSRIEWRLENGEHLADQDIVERNIPGPGKYTFSLTAWGRGFASWSTDSATIEVDLTKAPTVTPQRKIVEHPFSFQATSPTIREMVFKADKGYSIDAVEVKTTKAIRASVISVTHDATTATLRIRLSAGKSVAGLRLKTERAFLGGVMKIQESEILGKRAPGE